MKLINILIFIVILLSFLLSILAQEPLSLQQAVAQGIENNYKNKNIDQFHIYGHSFL
jgi:hypothetical protein